MINKQEIFAWLDGVNADIEDYIDKLGYLHVATVSNLQRSFGCTYEEAQALLEEWKNAQNSSRK